MSAPAKIIAHSFNNFTGQEIISFEFQMWKPMLGELARHRVLSLSVASSRAVSLPKMRDMVRENPFIPAEFGGNIKGMTAGAEVEDANLAKAVWRDALDNALIAHGMLEKIGLHKQWANRLLEPFMIIPVLCTTTETTNLYNLRCHPDAQKEIREVIEYARELHENSIPEILREEQWHTVYLTDQEKQFLRNAEAQEMQESIVNWLRVSAARAARVSYFYHDGTPTDLAKDLDLCTRLAGMKPVHASPFEHQACCKPVHGVNSMTGNFTNGWYQHRKFLEINAPLFAKFDS